jgi:hypothetical protein
MAKLRRPAIVARSLRLKGNVSLGSASLNQRLIYSNPTLLRRVFVSHVTGSDGFTHVGRSEAQMSHCVAVISKVSISLPLAPPDETQIDANYPS